MVIILKNGKKAKEKISSIRYIKIVPFLLNKVMAKEIMNNCGWLWLYLQDNFQLLKLMNFLLEVSF